MHFFVLIMFMCIVLCL